MKENLAGIGGLQLQLQCNHTILTENFDRMNGVR